MKRAWALHLLAATAVAGAGVSAGILIARQPVPDSLEGAHPLTAAPTSQRDFTDARTLTMTVKPGEATPVLSPRAGRITAVPIEAGSSLSSGQGSIGIDGVGLIALATEIPLWRPLDRDMRGPDVNALQKELSRLGYEVAETGVMDWSTRFAAADLLGMDDGDGGVPNTIPHDRFCWIPSATVAVETVNARVGQSADLTEPLFTLGAARARASVQVPDDALEGEREISLGELSIAVDASGEVSDPEAITAILDSPQYAAAKETNKESEEAALQVEWRLRESTRVTVVPPGALFGLSGSVGCIAHEGAVIPVRVLGSQLGQTYILPETEVAGVDLNVEGLTCP